MSRPRVVEVDYYRLMEELRRAADSRSLIQRSDKLRWREYIERHAVREASLEAFGKVKFAAGAPRLAVIDAGSEWDGCYTYSVEDESALRYVP